LYRDQGRDQAVIENQGASRAGRNQLPFFLIRMGICSLLIIVGFSRRTVESIEKYRSAFNLAVRQCLLKLFHTLVGDLGVDEAQRLQVGQSF
jgi:hypothetical protein